MKKTKINKLSRKFIVSHKKARELRMQGWTHREIANELHISTSSAHEWTRGITLTADQKRDIQIRRDKKVWTKELRAWCSERAKSQHFGRKPLYSKSQLIEKIRAFYRENNRIPLKREFNMYETYKREFGSWNAAVRLAGFETNPELFAHKFISADGHSCDSFTEKIIDDWFYARGIAHERAWRYGDTKMTADFFIVPNIIIEFFGLAGVQKHYDELLQKKREFCYEHGLNLIELYPADLFPRHHIERKLSSSLILF